MASYSDIQHRFANKQEGKNGCVRSGNVRYEGRNFYSYSTVFGQWLDTEKNVCVYFDGSTTPSSTKHKLYRGLFPDDVHVFPYNDGNDGWYSYAGCRLISSEFKWEHRMQMIDHYVGRIYEQIAAINGGKKKGLENVSFEAWGYVEELCSLYKDTTINKYLKWTKKKEYKKLVKMLKTGERSVEVLTDALFGKGTFKTYWDYCARYRKAEDKKKAMSELCQRLGIAEPYERCRWGNRWKIGMTAKEVRNLTAKERIDIHFDALQRKEWYDGEDEREKAYYRRNRNAYKWIVGYEPTLEKWNGSVRDDVSKVRNMYTGEVYDMEMNTFRAPYWACFRVTFDYGQFRRSEDKEQWIREFYEKCDEVSRNVTALNFLCKVDAHEERKGIYSWTTGFVLDDYLLEKLAGDAEMDTLVRDYIERQDKHYADEQARVRAEAIERARREEEARKEREYREQVKQEQIDECIKGGAEGCRNLWRKHLVTVDGARVQYMNFSVDVDGAFYYDGNVLLRLNLNKDKVETSKHVRMPIEVAKKFFHIIKKWHENPSCFKEMVIDTKGSGKYTISSYEDDILTAGCHKIAYVEMERMYNEIVSL